MALYNPRLVEKLEELIEKDPGSRAFCSLARIFLEGGDLERAEQICLKGIAHNSSYSQAYEILGEICGKRGKIEKALDFFIKARELSPDSPNVYKSLGEIYKKQNNMEKTLSAYKMALFLRPWDKTALATVQHLEKALGRRALEPQPEKGLSRPPQKALSGRESQKLAKLNKILARAELYIK